MFEPDVYNTIFRAVYDLLNKNCQQLGRQFCEGFMTDYDVANGQQSQRNAQQLYDYVVRSAQQLNGGQMKLRDNQQLYDVVFSYISQVFDQWRNRQNQMQGGGFGGSQMSFGNNGGSMGGTSMFGGGSSGFGQQRSVGPGSHLSDDTLDTRPRQAPPQQAQQPAPSPTTPFTQPSKPATKYTDNPLDDLTDPAIDFMPVKVKPVWGEEKAKDRRIIIARRDDMKTRDSRFSVARMYAFHQQILNDPFQVLTDFVDVVPDSTLGSPFFFRILYNHLEVIDVPTADFLEIRTKCIEAITQDRQAVLHRKVMEVLDTMSRGPWKAMTNYLLKHINRALYLSCRSATKLNGHLQIGEFEDLDQLLSSSFQNWTTAIPEGRHAIEKIVGGAIWNAIVMNSGAMFKGKDIPTHAIQSSPAFPYSLEGVYPNKFAIPTSQESSAEDFLTRLHEQELSRKSYILSKRSVIITNALGKNILPNIGDTPNVVTNPVNAFLDDCRIPYMSMDIERENYTGDVEPNVSENYPSDQLEAYYNNVKESEDAEQDDYARKKATLFPVDQTIFALQYGVSPKDYLMSLDIFSTVDNKLNKNQNILVKRPISTIKITQ